MHLLETEALTRRYGAYTAVEGLSLHVRQGEIYGFLGLNGAGKTTTIRMLLGMIRPTSGSIRLFGQPLTGPSGPWNRVGSLVEAHAYPALTVAENLAVVLKLRKLKDKSLTDNIIRKLHLEPYRDIRAGNLSLGNRQRLGLAKALIHRPDLLLLDEPINGLDPAGIVEVRELLLDLAANGTTIFLSSHILSEIAKTTTRIGILHQGKLVEELNTPELPALLERRLRISTRDNEAAARILEQHGYQPIVREEGKLSLVSPLALQAPEHLTALLTVAGLPPWHVSVYEEDLESFFMRKTGAN